MVKAYEIINDRLTDNELSVCFRENILRTFRYLVKLKKTVNYGLETVSARPLFRANLPNEYKLGVLLVNLNEK